MVDIIRVRWGYHYKKESEIQKGGGVEMKTKYKTKVKTNTRMTYARRRMHVSARNVQIFNYY